MLAEPAPYDTSRAYGLESLPTTVLLDRDASVAGTVVGWDAGALSALVGQACDAVGAPAPEITRRAAAHEARLRGQVDVRRRDAGAHRERRRRRRDGGHVRARVDRRAAGRPADALARRRDARRPRPASGRSARCRPGWARRPSSGVAACAVLAGCRPEYFPVVLAAVEAALDPAFNLNGQAVTTQPAGQLVIVSGPVARGDRRAQRDGRARPRLAGEPHDRARAPARGHADRRRRARAAGPIDARAPRQARLLHRRGRGGQPVGAAARRARVLARRLGRDGRGLRRAAVDLRPPRHDAARTSRMSWAGPAPRRGARTGGRSAGRRSTSSAPSTRRCSPPPAGASSGCARRCSTPSASRRASCAAARRRRRSTPPTPTRSITKWDSPDDIVLIAAGGEAGRYSAVLGPCLGMSSQMVSREVAWST